MYWWHCCVLKIRTACIKRCSSWNAYMFRCFTHLSCCGGIYLSILLHFFPLHFLETTAPKASMVHFLQRRSIWCIRWPAFHFSFQAEKVRALVSSLFSEKLCWIKKEPYCNLYFDGMPRLLHLWLQISNHRPVPSVISARDSCGERHYALMRSVQIFWSVGGPP